MWARRVKRTIECHLKSKKKKDDEEDEGEDEDDVGLIQRPL